MGRYTSEKIDAPHSTVSVKETMLRGKSLALSIGGATATCAMLLALRRRMRPRLIDLVKSGKKAVCIGKNYHEHIAERKMLHCTL